MGDGASPAFVVGDAVLATHDVFVFGETYSAEVIDTRARDGVAEFKVLRSGSNEKDATWLAVNKMVRDTVDARREAGMLDEPVNEPEGAQEPAKAARAKKPKEKAAKKPKAKPAAKANASEGPDEEKRGLGPVAPGSADGKGKGKTAAEIEAEAAKNPGGFVHYAGDVHCKSARRPGSDAFDLTFHLFDQNGSNYRFRDCDATGKFAPGKTQGFLRSKLAVARYLEREGASGADAAERDAAVPDAGEKERPERAKDQRDAVAPTDPSADEADRGNAPASGVADAASPASPPSPPTRLEAIEALLKRFDAVLSQCMYCLYGVETAEPLRRCREEGGARSASNLMTPEACAEVWRHVQPYVASLGAEGRASASFARVLEKVRRAFPPTRESWDCGVARAVRSRRWKNKNALGVEEPGPDQDQVRHESAERGRPSGSSR